MKMVTEIKRSVFVKQQINETILKNIPCP